MKLFNVFNSFTTNIFKIKHNHKNTCYNYKDILKYIHWNNYEVREINRNIIFHKTSLITIQRNCYTVSEDRIQDSIDIFASIYKNRKANELIFYNNKKSEFIELTDSLCYGQYLQGMEFTEGNLTVNFDKIKDEEIYKIEIGLGIYEDNMTADLSLSKNHIKHFIITIMSNSVIYYLIQDNTISSESKFSIFLTFIKNNNQWKLSTEVVEYDSLKQYHNTNFEEIIN